MAVKYLGERLDIHCGGVDHQAVHHTNEIAQTEAAYGHKWVNWWMHGEFLVLPKEGGEAAKMAKSSGEFLTLDFLGKRGFDPLAFRYFCLNAHYRQQLAFAWVALDAAAKGYSRLKRKVLELRGVKHREDDKVIAKYKDAFKAAVEDDLNMPQALAVMWAAAYDRQFRPGSRYDTLLKMDEVLGLGIADMKADTLGDEAEKIQKLIDDRLAARKAKDYARADSIRRQLADMGIMLEDTPEGTTWRKI